MNSKQRRKHGRQIITLLYEASSDDKDLTIAEMAKTIKTMGSELDGLRKLRDNTLKDHEIRDMVNELRDVAFTYHATQQLRSVISGVVRKHLLKEPGHTTDPYPYIDVVKAHVSHCSGCEVCDAWRRYLND